MSRRLIKMNETVVSTQMNEERLRNHDKVFFLILSRTIDFVGAKENDPPFICVTYSFDVCK